MNILRLVSAEREKKQKPASAAFQKLEEEARVQDQGQCPIVFPKEKLQKQLPPVQFYVTQQKGTERYNIYYSGSIVILHVRN